MAALSSHVDKGEKLLDCAQGECPASPVTDGSAYVITATVDQYNAWWTDLWMLSGSAMRLAIPVRLNESSSKLSQLFVQQNSSLTLQRSLTIPCWPVKMSYWSQLGMRSSRRVATAPGGEGSPDEEILVKLNLSRMIYLLERSVTLSTCWPPVKSISCTA